MNNISATLPIGWIYHITQCLGAQVDRSRIYKWIFIYMRNENPITIFELLQLQVHKSTRLRQLQMKSCQIKTITSTNQLLKYQSKVYNIQFNHQIFFKAHRELILELYLRSPRWRW